MSELPLSTEPQQYAIDLVVSMLQDTYTSLFEKKKELESLEKTEEVNSSLNIIQFRLDTLGKVETKLLEPIKAMYKSAESIAQILNSEQRLLALQKQSDMLKHIDVTFTASIMQGL